MDACLLIRWEHHLNTVYIYIYSYISNSIFDQEIVGTPTGKKAWIVAFSNESVLLHLAISLQSGQWATLSLSPKKEPQPENEAGCLCVWIRDGVKY